MRRQNVLRRAACCSAKSFPGYLSVVSVTLICAAQSALGQSNEPPASAYVFDEVVVTAQRRSENAVDVPISITAIGADQLGQGDVQQLSDIMKLTPGLRFDFLGGNAQPTIRGVGSAVVVAGAGTNVAIYTDGFYSPNPLVADSELLSVESVQVLKGPQGTLFGRNSTGGAILVTTSDPNSDAHADVQASYGSYNTQRYQVYASGGPSDTLAFDVAALYRSSDGYLDNITTGSDDDGEYQNWAGRLGMRWDISDKITAILRYSHADVDDPTAVADNAYGKNGVVYSTGAGRGATYTTEPFDVASNFKPAFTAESDATQLTLKFDLGFAMLTSYSQYRDETATHHYDFDATSADILHYMFVTTDDIYTQEFLLSSTLDGPLQWTAGLFYFSDETEYPNNRVASEGTPFVHFQGSGVTAKSIAVFGDATYAMLDNLYLTVGVRYNKDKQADAFYFDDETQRNVGVSGLEDDQFTPRAALRYELDDKSNVYLSYSEGFKSGILNIAGDVSGDIEVDPEHIKAYEVGYKYASSNMQFDIAAFYYDYKDLQVATYDSTTSIIKNAASSTIQGLDAQARYAFTDRFAMNIGASYLDAEYDKFEESQRYIPCPAANASACGDYYIPLNDDASGNDMSRSPEFTATVGANYNVDVGGGKLDLGATLYHTSDFYFDSSNVYKQDAYDLLSARVAWTDPGSVYTVTLFGDNLTDEEYRSQVLPQAPGTLSTWGAPRTVGVSVDAHF